MGTRGRFPPPPKPDKMYRQWKRFPHSEKRKNPKKLSKNSDFQYKISKFSQASGGFASRTPNFLFSGLFCIESVHFLNETMQNSIEKFKISYSFGFILQRIWNFRVYWIFENKQKSGNFSEIWLKQKTVYPIQYLPFASGCESKQIWNL